MAYKINYVDCARLELTDDEVLTIKLMLDQSRPTPGDSLSTEQERKIKLLKKLLESVRVIT